MTELQCQGLDSHGDIGIMKHENSGSDSQCNFMDLIIFFYQAEQPSLLSSKEGRRLQRKSQNREAGYDVKMSPLPEAQVFRILSQLMQKPIERTSTEMGYWLPLVVEFSGSRRKISRVSRQD